MILADDCWQECGSHGAEGWTYHNELGRPVIDQEKFPNMRSMTSLGHSLNLTVGWYHNNCRCHDHCTNPICFAADVNATLALGFDSVKVCSAGKRRGTEAQRRGGGGGGGVVQSFGRVIRWLASNPRAVRGHAARRVRCTRRCGSVGTALQPFHPRDARQLDVGAFAVTTAPTRRPHLGSADGYSALTCCFRRTGWAARDADRDVPQRPVHQGFWTSLSLARQPQLPLESERVQGLPPPQYSLARCQGRTHLPIPHVPPASAACGRDRVCRLTETCLP
jgi:hypothetical protein